MRWAAVSLFALSLGGCGTVTRGSTEPVTFASEPPGAAVRTSLGSGCPTTPCTIEISRKSEFVATFSLPGYREQQVPVTTLVSGGGGASMAGNILIGGLIGVGIDAANGTALDHDPNPVVARMTPAGGGVAVSSRRGRRGRPSS